MEWLLIVVALLVLAVLLIKKVITLATAHSPTRLLRFLPQFSQFRIYIGVPLEEPARWTRLTGADARRKLITLGKQSVALSQVRAFLVAAKSGEVITAMRPFAPLPKGIHTDDDDLVKTRAGLTRSMLAAGQQFVRVSFTRNPEDATCAIHLQNISTEPITVLQYGCYQPDGDRYTLATNTGDFFSNEDFHRWYRLTQDHLAPAQQVSDPRAPWVSGRLWAFFCRSASGIEFIGGAVMENEDDRFNK